jgi:hypothetical protein
LTVSSGSRGSEARCSSDGPVVEVFPQTRLAFQVDLNGSPATSVIDKKPNSSNHRVSFLLRRTIADQWPAQPVRCIGGLCVRE